MIRRLAVLLAPAVLAFVVYSFALDMPLFADDGNLHAMIHDYGPEGVPGLRFWGGSLSYQYYRPLGMSVLELSYGSDGRMEPFALHLFSVVVFSATAALIAALARRLTGKDSSALIAGGAFALYPFAYRAVTWVAALFHVMVAFGLVLALLAGLAWIDRKRDVFPLIVAALGTFIALFSQELGVLTGPLLVGLTAAVHGPRAVLRPRALALYGLVAALTLVYLALYFGIPRPAAGPVTFHAGELPGSLAVFSQGLFYPVFAVLRRLTLAAPQTIPMLALAAGGAALGLWLGGRARWRIGVFALGAFVLLALPASLLLGTEYLKGSPHVLMPAAIGVALFWGVMLPGAFAQPAGRVARVKQAAAIAVIAGGVIISAAYLNARRAEAVMMSEHTYALLDMIDPATDERTILLNTPAFLSALEHDRWFFAGSEATMFFEGTYATHDLVFRAMTGVEYPRLRSFVHVPSFVAPPSYVFAPYWTGTPDDLADRLARATRIIATVFEGDHFYPAEVTYGQALPNGFVIP